ncbi:YwmB family TATA-box binding protein [Halobacillus mangrovi]|uniref:YwmB family TATA-box binding protein n=1 Tax=Halobacillus mangrovi TaxID=402384 RepID=UPI003D963251
MKMIGTVLIATIIFLLGANPQEMSAGKDSPVLKFAAFAEDEQLEVNEWKITIKQPFEMNDLEARKNELISYYKDSVIKTENTTNSSKIIFKDAQEKTTFNETFILIVPKEKGMRPEMVYVASGQGTSSMSPANMSKPQEVKSRFFGEKVNIFSCLKAKSSGIIDDVLVYQKFRQTFNIQPIDEVIEHGWSSRTGYTKEWGQAIPVAGDHMNVQFASRTLGGETNITIGTPIITAEY